MRNEQLSLLTGNGIFKSKTRSGKKFKTRIRLLAKKAPKARYGIGDTEQTRENGGIVFSYTVNSCSYCIVSGEYVTRKSLTIVFSGIRSVLFTDDKNKLDVAIENTKAIGGVVKELSFRKGMNEIVNFVKNECDGHLLHHCIDKDIQFLKNTQEYMKMLDLKDCRFFKQNTGSYYKGNICYNTDWDTITFTDTCKLLNNPDYNPKSQGKFIEWSKENSQDYLTRGKKCIGKLSSWLKFVTNDVNYIQKHNSLDDVLDLLKVCNYVMKTEGTSIRKCDIVDNFSAAISN